MIKRPRGTLLKGDYPVSFYDVQMRKPRRQWRHLAPLYDAIAMRVAGAQKVLELGCGIGRLANRLGRRGCEVWALDFAPSAIDRTAAFAGPGIDIRTVLQDLRQPYPRSFPRDFDAAIAVEVLEHIGDDLGVVGRALERAPRFLASVPNGGAVPSREHVRKYDQEVIRERFSSFGEVFFCRYRDSATRLLFEVQR